VWVSEMEPKPWWLSGQHLLGSHNSILTKLENQFWYITTIFFFKIKIIKEQSRTYYSLLVLSRNLQFLWVLEITKISSSLILQMAILRFSHFQKLKPGKIKCHATLVVEYLIFTSHPSKFCVAQCLRPGALLQQSVVGSGHFWNWALIQVHNILKSDLLDVTSI